MATAVEDELPEGAAGVASAAGQVAVWRVSWMGGRRVAASGQRAGCAVHSTRAEIVRAGFVFGRVFRREPGPAGPSLAVLIFAELGPGRASCPAPQARALRAETWQRRRTQRRADAGRVAGLDLPGLSMQAFMRDALLYGCGFGYHVLRLGGIPQRFAGTLRAIFI